MASAISFALAACGHNHAHEGHDHADETKNDQAINISRDHDHDIIELCPEAAKEAGITTAKAEKQPFFRTIPSTGVILPMNGEIISVTAKNPGFIMLDLKKILSGMRITSGEKIMVITGRGITDSNYEEQVLQADITYGNARQAYERNKALRGEKLVTDGDFLESEAAFRSAELRRNNLRKGFEQGGIRVSSPITGFVTEVMVNEGDYVETGQTLFTVAKNNNVTLRADVSPAYATLIPKISSANFRTAASADFVSVKDSGGKLISSGSSIDPETMMVPVYLSVPYNSAYMPGAFAQVNLILDEGGETIVLPKSAVIEDFGHYFVYVAEERGYEKRDIGIGGSDGINISVTSGIKEGEEVVINGATRLKLVERLGSMGEEAAHAGHSH